MESVPANPRCFNCDYLLRNLTEARCPECGRPFDPAKSATVNTTGRAIGWWKLLLRPPGIPLTLLALAAPLVEIWYARNPGGQFAAGMSLLVLSILAAVPWLVRLGAHKAVVVAYSCPRDLRPSNWRWVLTPLILLGAWIVPLDAVVACSFRYSRASLEQYARDVMRNPNAQWPPRRMGLLNVRVVDASPTMVQFFCGYGYDAASCGYFYSPSNAPTSTDANFMLYPLGGPWYEYSDHRSSYAPTVTAGPTTGGS